MNETTTDRQIFKLPPRTAFVTVLESSIAIIFGILALMGNSMVFIAIFRNKTLRKVPTFLLLNLAVADLLSAICCFPLLTSVLVKGKWMFGGEVCQFNAFQTYASYACSLLTMAATSVTRYFATVHPVRHRTIFRTKTLTLMLSAVWVFSFAFASMPLLGWGRYIFEPFYALCLHEQKSSASYNLFLFCFLLVNSSTIIACYLRIFKAMKRRNHQIQSLCSQGVHPKQQSVLSAQEIKLTNTIFIVICLFAVCYLPTIALGFVMFTTASVPRFAKMLSTFSVGLTCVVNPVVYWVRNRGFRETVMAMFHCRLSSVNTPRIVVNGNNTARLYSLTPASTTRCPERHTAELGTSSIESVI